MVSEKEGLPFARDLSLENPADFYLCFQLALLHLVSYFFFSSIDHLRLCAQFLILFHLTLRFCRSTHLLMFLSLETSIIRTGLPILVELIVLVNSVYNFSISNDLTQIVNFPSRIPDDCDSHSPALLDFFFFSIKTFIIYKQTIYSQQKLKYD